MSSTPSPGTVKERLAHRRLVEESRAELIAMLAEERGHWRYHSSNDEMMCVSELSCNTHDGGLLCTQS